MSFGGWCMRRRATSSTTSTASLRESSGHRNKEPGWCDGIFIGHGPNECLGPSPEHSQVQGPARGYEGRASGGFGRPSNLQTGQQKEKEAKDALAAVRAELEEARPKLQEAEATKAALAAALAELDSAKAGAEEAKAALETEKAASSTAMKDMLYHCWAYNPDGDFSFLGANGEVFLEGFKARLQQEAPAVAE
ncbi:uncharacterized protein LOC133821274 [Humulus lupulus]|uniref:uncharacterized protein LOC133821274 n=1 Tax=Humulus lupulus TaxID=3486 RepID=UPI002B411630|nr:uncharacterized protein LOC133821274 [Humulus lupulus]